ncbi:hypothetical protein DFJ63DRAFT_333830 [Scheffersomyces coipomensis]|uniref:uncharacterized protein n=1 Tax=Scheffersomyces coipomensis TaxID=1788519 RepID=UPI00315D7B49
MVGSSSLPRINGDTDDDASIHLHATIGPAKPLIGSHKKPIIRTEVDEKIYHELRDITDNNGIEEEEEEKDYDDDYDNGPVGLSHHDLNDSFRKYQQQLVNNNGYDNDSDDEEEEDDDYVDFNDDDDTTEVESEGDELDFDSESDGDKELKALNERVKSFNQSKYYNHSPIQTLLPSSDKPNQSLFDEFKTTTENQSVEISDDQPETVEPEIEDKEDEQIKDDKPEATIPNQTSAFATIDNSHTYKSLIEITDKLSKRQDFLEDNLSSSSSFINSKFDSVNTKLESIEKTVVENLNNFKQEITLLQSIQGSENLDDSTIHDNLVSIKKEIVDEFVNNLPQYVPVYIQNGKIHFVPQFHKYLYNFVENYHQAHASNTTTIAPLTNSTTINTHFMDKQELERYLDKRFLSNNKFFISKFNTLIDSLDLSTSNLTNINESSEKLIKSTNKILLRELLKVLSNGSIKINYSDYTLGSRILGFLTKSNLKNSSTSISHKLLLGWYDYVSGSGVKDLGYNANSVILNTDQSWKCQSITNDQPCSIGIRLSDTIVISDLVISVNPDFEGEVSIWIKPSQYKIQGQKLLTYLQGLKISNTVVTTTNKYLSRFFKIKQFKSKKIDTQSNDKLLVVKFPVSLISLEIASKDIYIEFKSSNPIEINNIKTYGISELNANRYDKQFQLMFDKIYNEDNEVELFDQEEVSHGDVDTSPSIPTYDLLDDDEYI